MLEEELKQQMVRFALADLAPTKDGSAGEQLITKFKQKWKEVEQLKHSVSHLFCS